MGPIGLFYLQTILYGPILLKDLEARQAVYY